MEKLEESIYKLIETVILIAFANNIIIFASIEQSSAHTGWPPSYHSVQFLHPPLTNLLVLEIFSIATTGHIEAGYLYSTLDDSPL